MFSKSTLVLFSLGLALAGAAGAQTLLSLPDSTTLGSNFSADVSEQATCTVPTTVHFVVSNVAASTDASLQSVTCSDVLLNDGKALKISLKANAAAFTPPTGGTVTWSAGDVTWDGPAWTGITGGGTSGTLSTSFSAVATSDANAPTVSTASLKFTLAAKATVDRAGSHTLAATWKFESI
jgi:hypothetical protein